eukprot:GHVS01051614.1.p1 GENE.GHVS01051614.1~~GHVS01051614.1.p1  ORF type:complete len:100 (-),score=7.19 GHVS01051614.1:1374-1673(-)
MPPKRSKKQSKQNAGTRTSATKPDPKNVGKKIGDISSGSNVAQEQSKKDANPHLELKPSASATVHQEIPPYHLAHCPSSLSGPTPFEKKLALGTFDTTY